MAHRHSRSLVIDASVARAAGPEDAVHPTAKHCRDFLLAVREICHQAIFTQAIADEWKKHQSGFARQWRLSMFARKKIERLDVPEDGALRNQLAQAAANDKDRNAILKDAHLLEASLVKSARDIMRKDKGLNGDLDRLPMLTWILFLKFLDDHEAIREDRAKMKREKFRSVIEAPYRWRDWAAKEDGHQRRRAAELHQSGGNCSP